MSRWFPRKPKRCSSLLRIDAKVIKGWPQLSGKRRSRLTSLWNSLPSEPQLCLVQHQPMSFSIRVHHGRHKVKSQNIASTLVTELSNGRSEQGSALWLSTIIPPAPIELACQLRTNVVVRLNCAQWWNQESSPSSSLMVKIPVAGSRTLVPPSSSIRSHCGS